jgi:hypothetical protein
LGEGISRIGPGRANVKIREWVIRPLPAYASILLLQLKVVWGMWWARDLTTGDTSGYFFTAHRWSVDGFYNLVWSPLYTVYYGSFIWTTADAYKATVAHRLVLVLITTLLVLALMRRFLEPRVAWLAAAWWAVQPINFNVLYEVHLFGVLPVVLAGLLQLGPTSTLRRGSALAIMLAGTLFLRNELLVPTLLLAATTALYEFRAWRRTDPRARAGWSRLFAASAPSVGVLLVFVGLLVASPLSPARLSGVLEAKHSVNVCQIYAFGYQQRHPEWEKSPWTECYELMQRTFGQPRLSMAAAVRANPKAMLEHFTWNVSLIPNGLQVLLFGVTAGRVRPGYEPIVQTPWAIALSVILILLLLGGVVALVSQWSYWWPTWIRPRIWGWLTLAFVCIGSVGVMVMQRPRPAYLFAVEITVQAVAALCLQAVVRAGRLETQMARAFPVLMVLLLVAVPSYYPDRSHRGPRPLRELYRALAPYQDMLSARGVTVATPGYGNELCNYLALDDARRCQALNYYELRREVSDAAGFWVLLDARAATMLYVNEAMAKDPLTRAALANAGAAGWEVVMRKATPRGERLLLRRRGTQPVQGAGVHPLLISPS